MLPGMYFHGTDFPDFLLYQSPGFVHYFVNPMLEQGCLNQHPDPCSWQKLFNKCSLRLNYYTFHKSLNRKSA